MILVLSDESSISNSIEAIESLSFRDLDSVERVVESTRSESIERVCVAFPYKKLNAFSLGRALRRLKGPPVVLFGALEFAQRFWAERNGCLTAGSLEEAVTLEGKNP